MAEPKESIEPLHEKNSQKRKPTWAREIIQDVEIYGAPNGMHRERKIPKPYNTYVDSLCDSIDKEPFNYKKAVEKKEWKEAMIE